MPRKKSATRKKSPARAPRSKAATGKKKDNGSTTSFNLESRLPLPNLSHVATSRLAQIWFVALFVGVVGLVIWMAWDFQGPIVFGLIIAGAFYPLIDFMIRRWNWSRRLAAIATTIIILLCVILPCIYIAVRLAQEAKQASDLITAWLTEANIQNTFFDSEDQGKLLPQIGREIFGFFNEPYTLDNVKNLAMGTATTISSKAIEIASGLAGGTLQFFFQFFLMMLVVYSIFTDGPKLKEFLLKLSPLPREDEELIIDRFNQMNFVTLVCNGIGGIIQGGLAGLGFWIAGIPSTLLWTVLMVLLAFIPLVGISFVYIPACLYLILIGHYYSAAIVFVYCTIISLVTENWFKPIFMGNRIRMNSMLVFFSIIGGMSVFGMAGIFYGPLIIIIFLTFVQLYLEKYEQNLNS